MARQRSLHEPLPCHDNKSNDRAAFYAKGASVFPRQGIGLMPQIRNQLAAEVRIAIIIPWIREGSDMSSCEGKKVARHGPLSFSTPCEVFGRATLPPSWPFWVASAAANADVADFLLMHGPDVDPSAFHLRAGLHGLPSNVRAVLVPNITSLYRRRIGIDIHLTDDKVKDFKPMVGHVFRQYLQPYSHWGFGDIDVVYGRFRGFLTRRVLAHDIITFRCDDVCFPMTKTVFAGQLTLFANNDWTRTLYRAPVNWQRPTLAREFKFFDERILPTYILGAASHRVAMVIGQITDRTIKRPTSRAVRRHLLWLAKGGQLIAVRSLRTKADEWCIESEFALAHLALYKLRHYSATPNASAARNLGFLYTQDRGIVPLDSLASTSEARVVAGLVDRGVLRRACTKLHNSYIYEGTPPP